MTKTQLYDLIAEAQYEAQGCGCCAYGDPDKKRKEVVEEIWNAMKKLKRRRQRK